MERAKRSSATGCRPVPPVPRNNFDLLTYFKDAASHGYAGISNDSYMLGVQTGFEVYSGNWTTTDYNITIQ